MSNSKIKKGIRKVGRKFQEKLRKEAEVGRELKRAREKRRAVARKALMKAREKEAINLAKAKARIESQRKLKAFRARKGFGTAVSEGILRLEAGARKRVRGTPIKTKKRRKITPTKKRKRRPARNNGFRGFDPFF
jgi:hypothetical protein